MKTIAVLLAFTACASAGLLGPVYHSHGPVLHAPAVIHGPVIAAAPVVKHVHPEIYAVPPPILAKPVVYAPPVVKVLHHPAPIVKTVHFGPYDYGYHGHGHHHHHHHHAPFFF